MGPELLTLRSQRGLRRREERGVHFMWVPKWLGHSSYVLTLTTSADYIPDKRLRTRYRTCCRGGRDERRQSVWVTRRVH